jgi:hypothetical protein
VETPPCEGAATGSGDGESIHEIRPWREVGWIFRDGATYAIERQGERTRSRAARISHIRDEESSGSQAG